MTSKNQFLRSSIENLKEEKSTIDVEDFCKEIAELIVKKEKGEIKGMFELLSINPKELTEEDAHMWNKANNYKSNSFIEDEFKEYLLDVKNSKNSSREEFSSIIKQLFSIVHLREQQEDYENSKKK